MKCETQLEVCKFNMRFYLVAFHLHRGTNGRTYSEKGNAISLPHLTPPHCDREGAMQNSTKSMEPVAWQTYPQNHNYSGDICERTPKHTISVAMSMTSVAPSGPQLAVLSLGCNRLAALDMMPCGKPVEHLEHLRQHVRRCHEAAPATSAMNDVA